jgi:hypothetical protein
MKSFSNAYRDFRARGFVGLVGRIGRISFPVTGCTIGRPSVAFGKGVFDL